MNRYGFSEFAKETPSALAFGSMSTDIIARDKYNCPLCKQKKGEHCIDNDGNETDVHRERHDELTQYDWNRVTQAVSLENRMF